MSAKDRAIVARWSGLLAIRKSLLLAARKRHEWNPTAKSRDLLEKRKKQVGYAERVIARRKGWTPPIKPLGATVTNQFGALGPIQRTIGHYTAGPRDTSDAHALALWRDYHRDHAAKGWGGIGYHYGITSAGTIVPLRPIASKGAHTAKKNTGSVGIVVHGGPGQRMTTKQRMALEWLYDNAHTSAMPVRHRSPKNLRTVHHGVHRDYTPTQCPDSYEIDYKAA